MRTRLISIIIMTTVAALAVSCSPKDTDTTLQEAKQSNEDISEMGQNNEEADSETSWTAEGNYIDDQDNHLVIYRTSVELGYSQDGFGAMLIIGDEIYSGDLDEKAGELSGTLSVYTDDGSQGEEVKVSLKDMGEYILLTKADGEEMKFSPDDTDYSDPNFLPMFSYNNVLVDIEYNSLEAAAYDYLSFDYMKDYDVSNAIIPYVQIVDIDETDPEDVLLYGDYYVWEFAKDNDILKVVSGGHCPGIIHLERFGDVGEGAVYSPKGTMDEAFTDEDAKTIFGEYYEHYHQLSSDDQAAYSGIAQIIADYVAVNNLDITKYQISEGDVKELPESRARRVTGLLPQYEYLGEDELYSVLHQYMIDELNNRIYDDEVCIPCPIIVDVDESNKEDILIYGDFWTFTYYLDGDIMKCSSGGSNPGCIHVGTTDDGYEVTGMDMVQDGSRYISSVKEIFGEHYDEFMKMEDDMEEREKIRAEILTDYVNANGLDVTAYQDYGWDPVPLQ